MVKTFTIGFVAVLVLAFLVTGFWFYPQRGVENQSANQPLVAQQINVNPQSQEQQDQNPFPLSLPPAPPFVENLKSTGDVKIDLHYEGDYNSPFSWRAPEFYIPEGGTEKFLSLSRVKDRKNQYDYGPESYSIFTSQGSHSYQGTPIYLLNQNSKYTVSYIGFKINDRELLSELKVEFGIDYLADRMGAAQEKTSTFLSIFRTQTVHACGPGIYLRNVGGSDLVFVEEINGIAWYRLEKPIALHNLSLDYCDTHDPDYCYSNVNVENLANGNLRMHVFYKPNNKEGFLKLQMVNLVLSDPAGTYHQVVMGENFSHYYRAYLR